MRRTFNWLSTPRGFERSTAGLYVANHVASVALPSIRRELDGERGLGGPRDCVERAFAQAERIRCWRAED